MRVTRSDLPPACTLGPADGLTRVERWRRLDRLAAPEAVATTGRLEVRYRPVEGVAEELRGLAAAEQECCAFVTWGVTVADGVPTLHVDAPADRPEAVVPIVALFGVPLSR